jgi:hypothetical protein
MFPNLGASVLQSQAPNALQSTNNPALRVQASPVQAQSGTNPGMNLNQTSGATYNLSQPTPPTKAQPIVGGQVLGANTTTGPTPGNGQATTNPASLAAINSAYNPSLQYYENEKNIVPGQNAMAANDSNRYFDSQAHGLQDQFQSGNQNLDLQTKVLNDSYNRSLQQLGNNIRSQYQGQQNAMGIGGAGDSSANQMSAYALANEQNMNRGYMNTDLNNQLGQVGLQRDAMNSGFKDQLDGVNAQKQSAYDQINQQYQNLLDQVQKSEFGTQQAKESAMMWTNNWAANQVAQVDKTMADQGSAILQQYANLPNQHIALNNMPTYQASAITGPSVSAQQQTAQQVAPSAPLLAPGYSATQHQNPLMY